jgi:hypothetical protein
MHPGEQDEDSSSFLPRLHFGKFLFLVHSLGTVKGCSSNRSQKRNALFFVVCAVVLDRRGRKLVPMSKRMHLIPSIADPMPQTDKCKSTKEQEIPVCWSFFSFNVGLGIEKSWWRVRRWFDG